MKIARIGGRAHLVDESDGGLRAVDVETASDGRFSSSVKSLLEDIDALRGWAESGDVFGDAVAVDRHALQAPVPNPSQILAIGMNYQDHAAEVSIAAPESPAVFTKFDSSLVGAEAAVRLPSLQVDWEVELVAVVGAGGRNITRDHALSRIAGYAVGQDLSCRELQFAASSSPQFSLGKSYEGFAPVGPWITTADEVDVESGVDLVCRRGDQILQNGSTAHLIFDIPTLIEHLSSVVELRPGDLIFTGTPDGVGFGRNPKEYLKPGDVLTSSIPGLGEISQSFY